jgi:predicted glycosyltransferase
MEQGTRLLIYSHDSFGLGHLRRCRTIAHHLVDRFRHLSVLILSGSPIIGSFDFRSRVDFVRVPGVIKLRNGEYVPQTLRLGIDEMLEMRRSIIHHTAAVFEPDVFLVDKEPLGLRGEVRSTLEMLKGCGTRCVLGLRDVMDEPASLVEEWERKAVFPALAGLYDDIWVYGLPEIFDPLSEIPGLSGFASKLRFTGYLRRTLPDRASERTEHPLPEGAFILVTPGGGGDGAELIDWVIRAYEGDRHLPHRAVLLLGPFMPVEQRLAFQERVNRDARLEAITFEALVEPYFERASGVVAMGGYNTFCEILSFGKPALLVPRTAPRLEQHLRAERAQRLGLLRMLPDDGVRPAARMAACLRELPGQRVAGEGERTAMLHGLDRITRLIAPWLAPGARERELRGSRYA